MGGGRGGRGGSESPAENHEPLSICFLVICFLFSVKEKKEWSYIKINKFLAKQRKIRISGSL